MYIAYAGGCQTPTTHLFYTSPLDGGETSARLLIITNVALESPESCT
jgi:hypothetical protein